MRPPIGHIGGIAGVGENEADRLNRELNPDHLRMEAAKDRARGTFNNIPEFAKAVKASRAEEQGSGQGHPDHITAKASRSEIAGNQSVVDEAHRMKQAEAAQPMAERQPQFDEDGRKRNHFDTDATLFHEIGHWTGSEGRLAREFGKRFGDKAYAFEELVALS